MARAVQIAACILVGVGGFMAGQSALPQAGLRGHYFTNLAGSGDPVAIAIDPDVSTESLGSGVARAWSTYAVEWTGSIVITQSGTHTFATVSDDGSEMDVAGVTVVRNGGLHGAQEATGTIELHAGVHPIRVRYEQAGGGYHLELKHGFGGGPITPIAADALLPDETSLIVYRARRTMPLVASVIAMLAFVAARRFAPAVRIPSPAFLRLFERQAVALGVLIAIAVLCRAVMMLGSNGILWADSDVFLDTSNAIGRGNYLEHDPYRTLLYPYFLFSFLAWSGEKPMDQVIVGAQHALGLLSVIGFFIAARAAFSVRVALVGTLLLAVHTTQLFYENSILTEALFNALLAWSLVAIVGYVRQPTLRRAVTVAAACVVLTMTRPAAQAFIAVPVVVSLAVAAPWRQRLICAVTMSAIYTAALLPWMALNQRTYGFHGVAMGRGLGLFIRTSQIERYEPALYRGYPEVQELLTLAQSTQSATGHVVDGLRRRGYSSAQVDDVLYRASVGAISQRPIEFAAHSLRQWWRQLGSLDDEDICTGEQGAYICSDRTIGYAREPFLNRPLHADSQPTRSLVVWYFRHARIPMHVVTVLAVFGVIAGVAARPSVRLLRLMLALTVIYFTLLPAITQSLQDRFRLPVDALLFTFAAFGASALVDIVLRRTSSN